MKRQVVIVKPGYVRTAIAQNSLVTDREYVVFSRICAAKLMHGVPPGWRGCPRIRRYSTRSSSSG